MKKILGTGLGITIGGVIYDYLSHGTVDWIRAIAIGIIATIILFLFEKSKSKR